MTRIGTRREPEYKQLNFDTTMRNPERLKDVLLLVKSYEGVELNDKNLLDIVCDMYENGIVKSDEFNIKKLHSKEQIQNKIIEINKELESKKINIKESGSIAEAALKLNNIFEDAQKSIDDYVSNIKDRCEEMIKETKNKCTELSKNNNRKKVKVTIKNSSIKKGKKGNSK